LRIRLAVLASIVLAAVALTLAPARPAAASGVVCVDRGSFWNPSKVCLYVEGSGTYVQHVRVYIQKFTAKNGHWQLRYHKNGVDNYRNSPDWYALTHCCAGADYTFNLNTFVDNNTYVCGRYWRQYAAGKYDLPYGDWNCLKVHT